MINLKQILNEDIDVGNSLFGEHGAFNVYMNQMHEKDTPEESRIYKLIEQWYNGGLHISAQLFKEKDNIKELSKRYPEVFKSPENSLMYRYLMNNKNEYIKQIITISKSLYDTNNSNNKLFIYDNILVFKNIKYKPHRELTSWTVNYNTFKSQLRWMEVFGIISITNSNCFMNPKVSELFDMDNEEEIIHFGQAFNTPLNLAFSKELDIFKQLKIPKTSITIQDILINNATKLNNFNELMK